MHDAVGVARGQRVGDLGGEQSRRGRRERAVLAQVLVQVGALDEVHDQREQVALDDQVAGAHDVRVRQPEQDGALPQEAHHHVRVVGQLLLEDLDRDGLAGLAGNGRLGARGLPLAGSPDGARGAAPERLLEQVLAAYRPHVMRSLLIWLVCGPAVRSRRPAARWRRPAVLAVLVCCSPPVVRYSVPTHCSAAERGTVRRSCASRRPESDPRRTFVRREDAPPARLVADGAR